METRPSFVSQASKETIINRAVESIENSTLRESQKLDFILLILNRKQGVSLADSRIVGTSVKKKREIMEEFNRELSEILKLMQDIGLESEIVKKLSYKDNKISFEVLASKSKDVLNEFVNANNKDDDKTFGLILGFPKTAVDAYGTPQAFKHIEKELSKEEIQKLETEGLLPFITFMPSRDHWQEEIEWARKNKELIKQRAPKLYRELMAF